MADLKGEIATVGPVYLSAGLRTLFHRCTVRLWLTDHGHRGARTLGLREDLTGAVLTAATASGHAAVDLQIVKNLTALLGHPANIAI